MATVTMQGAVGQGYQASPSNTRYTADGNGIIAGVAGNDVPSLQAAGCLVLNTGRNNLTATTDPSTSNDSTQNYAVGSQWLNTTLSRVWTCTSAAAGAATWSIDGIVPGTGAWPSAASSQFGSSTGSFSAAGNVSRQVFGSATLFPFTTASDCILATTTLPANIFDQAGRGISITAAGQFLSNVNVKECKIWVGVGSVTGIPTGATVVADTGSITGTTAAAGIGWELQANVFKFGAAASNTQYSQATGINVGTSNKGINAPVFTTLTESLAINVYVTGNAATGTGDIILNMLEIGAMN